MDADDERRRRIDLPRLAERECAWIFAWYFFDVDALIELRRVEPELAAGLLHELVGIARRLTVPLVLVWYSASWISQNLPCSSAHAAARDACQVLRCIGEREVDEAQANLARC